MNRNFNLANTITLNCAILPHFKKTDSIMYLPMMKNVKEKIRKLHLFDLGYKSRHSDGVNPKNLFKINKSLACAQDDEIAAFTLAETLIALTIIGVVASITIPSLIRQYLEATNRTKVKKAMAAYEKVVSQISAENNMDVSLKSLFGYGNCEESSKYFKTIKVLLGYNNCRFQTSDKVWWDISDIEHPIIALKQEDLDNENAENRFEFFAHNEDGILRVNDKADEKLSVEDKANLEKLYAFVNKEISSGSSENPVGCNNSDLKCRYEKEKCADDQYQNCIEMKSCEDAMIGAETCDYVYISYGDMGEDSYIGYKTSSNGETYIAYEQIGDASADPGTFNDFNFSLGSGEGTYVLRSEKSDGTPYVSVQYEGQESQSWGMIGSVNPYNLKYYSEDPVTHNVYKSMEDDLRIYSEDTVIRIQKKYNADNQEVSKKIYVFDNGLTDLSSTCTYNYETNEYETSGNSFDCNSL